MHSYTFMNRRAKQEALHSKVYICIYLFYIHIYIYVHIYVRIYIYICMSTCICIGGQSKGRSILKYMYVYMYLLIYMCVHIYVCVCLYMFISTYICIGGHSKRRCILECILGPRIASRTHPKCYDLPLMVSASRMSHVTRMNESCPASK